MPYLILAKDDKRIIHISETLDYQENGNYLILEGTIAVPPSIVDLVAVDSIPFDVEVEKFLYIDGEFVANTHWVDPQILTGIVR